MSEQRPIGPTDYMNRFLKILFLPESGPTGFVSVSKYLQNDGGPRAVAALGAKDALLAQVMKENEWKNPSAPPAKFTVGDRSYGTKAIVEAFMGKGSPDQIADVLRLAHHFGFISNSAKKSPKTPALSAQEYCDRYLGLDCNGFVGNYFGLDPNTIIGFYDVKSARRSSVQRAKEGDVLVWAQDGTGYPHIALLDSPLRESLEGQKHMFRVVQASGKDGLGLHESLYDEAVRVDGAGISFADPLRHAKVYFLPPPLQAGRPTA